MASGTQTQSQYQPHKTVPRRFLIYLVINFTPCLQEIKIKQFVERLAELGFACNSQYSCQQTNENKSLRSDLLLNVDSATNCDLQQITQHSYGPGLFLHKLGIQRLHIIRYGQEYDSGRAAERAVKERDLNKHSVLLYFTNF